MGIQANKEGITMKVKIVTKQVKEYVINGLSAKEIYDLQFDSFTQEKYLYDINNGNIMPYKIYTEYVSDILCNDRFREEE